MLTYELTVSDDCDSKIMILRSGVDGRHIRALVKPEWASSFITEKAAKNLHLVTRPCQGRSGRPPKCVLHPTGDTAYAYIYINQCFVVVQPRVYKDVPYDLVLGQDALKILSSYMELDF